MVIGTGTDIVEVGRIKALIEKAGRRFLERWFDAQEIAYCDSKAKPYLHFAARFAAKEAVFKALRLSAGYSVCWKDIVVLNDPDGFPRLVLRGRPQEEAARRGVARLHLSLSHCEGYAIAMVTVEGESRADQRG